MTIFISIFKKKIDQINLTDIEDLINQNVRESSLIEYKGADVIRPGRDDLQQKFWKLIQITCGFANNMGGLLILGIREDSNSCADGVTPLHQNKSDLINKLRGLTVSHTVPSISLQISDIDTNPDNLNEYILVLKIIEAPEPVMYINSSDNDSNKYFFRYNEDTIPADHATLRLLFSKKSIEEKLSKYLKSREYGLQLGEEENVVSWISIPYQFPLETFTVINGSVISTLRRLYPRMQIEHRFHAIFENGRYSHNGILFLHQNSRTLYYGFFEIKNNGYIEFKSYIALDQGFIQENYIIVDFEKFLEYLFNFYSSYGYFGDIKIILSIKKRDSQLKLGLRDITGVYPHNNNNNFSPENKIHMERVISIEDIESETNRSEIYINFKKELHACFGIP